MKDEALKMALKALKACNRCDLKVVDEAIEAAEKALAQPEPINLAEELRRAVQKNDELISNERRLIDRLYEFERKTNQLSQPAQEPVAWMYQHPNNHRKTCYQTYKPSGECTPLYTAPPQRPWVGLTDEEIQPRLNGLLTQSIAVYARNIEAILKEKNNG